MTEQDLRIRFERIFIQLQAIICKGLFGGAARKKMESLRETAWDIFYKEFKDV